MTRFIPSMMKICNNLFRLRLRRDGATAEDLGLAALTSAGALKIAQIELNFDFIRHISATARGFRHLSDGTVVHALSQSSAANVCRLPIVDLAG